MDTWAGSTWAAVITNQGGKVPKGTLINNCGIREQLLNFGLEIHLF